MIADQGTLYMQITFCLSAIITVNMIMIIIVSIIDTDIIIIKHMIYHNPQS